MICLVHLEARGGIYGLSLNGSKLLFGDIWKFDEYCARHRKNWEHQSDDQIIESTLNGSALEALTGLGTLEADERLHGIDLDGIKARYATPVLCSINSWGYAEQSVEELSSRPLDDKTNCQQHFDELFDFVKSIASYSLKQSKNSNRGEKSVSNSNSTQWNFDDELTRPTSSNISSRFKLDYWRQFNSNGRAPSGLLHKAHLWLGDYDECLKLGSTRYCLGSYGSPSSKWPVEAYRVGLCLPRGCTSKMIVESGGNINKLDAMIKLNLVSSSGATRYQLKDLYCLPADDSPIRSLIEDNISLALLVVPLVWFIILTFETFKSRAQSLKAKDELGKASFSVMKGFNLFNSWRDFLKSNHLVVELAGLNAIKVIAMNWLMFSHVYLIFCAYTNNLQDIRQDSVLRALIIQGQHVVPTFFIISGILFGYKFLNKNKQLGDDDDGSRVFQLIVSRYLRLMPMYLIVYAYVKKFSHLLSSGPLWDYGVSIQSEARQCQLESWLVPIMMLSNFVLPLSHCVITGWHIANDFQIYLILPILLLAYKRSRRFGTVLALATFLTSHLTYVWFWQTTENFSARVLYNEAFIFGPTIIVKRLALAYVNPIGRAGTYFIGVLIADRLFGSGRQQHETSQMKARKPNEKESCEHIQMPPLSGTEKAGQIQAQEKFENLKSSSSSASIEQTQTSQILFSSFVLLVTLLSLANPMRRVFQEHLESLAYPASRLIIEVATSMLLYYFLAPRPRHPKDNNNNPADGWPRSQSSLGRCLKLPFWNVLVKLNYCTMLIHFTIARYVVQSQRQLLTFSWLNYIQTATLIIMLSYLFSLPLHLAVEVPLMKLVRVFLSKLFAKR